MQPSLVYPDFKVVFVAIPENYFSTILSLDVDVSVGCATIVPLRLIRHVLSVPDMILSSWLEAVTRLLACLGEVKYQVGAIGVEPSEGVPAFRCIFWMWLYFWITGIRSNGIL